MGGMGLVRRRVDIRRLGRLKMFKIAKSFRILEAYQFAKSQDI
jgi:hypothetical protein